MELGNATDRACRACYAHKHKHTNTHTYPRGHGLEGRHALERVRPFGGRPLLPIRGRGLSDAEGHADAHADGGRRWGLGRGHLLWWRTGVLVLAVVVVAFGVAAGCCAFRGD